MSSFRFYVVCLCFLAMAGGGKALADTCNSTQSAGSGAGPNLKESEPVVCDADAQYALGQYYEGQGQAHPDKYKLAAHWYQLAANQDFTPALTRLAYLTENGLGVERDESKALVFEQRAAELAHMPDQAAIPEKSLGDARNPEDYQAAQKGMKDAYDKGDTGAGIDLALSYLHPKYGAPNPEAARSLLEAIYYKKGPNYPYAAYQLALMYKDGDGVRQNPVTAYMWMTVPAHSSPPDDVWQQFVALQQSVVEAKGTSELPADCNVYKVANTTGSEWASGQEWFHADRGETISIIIRKPDFVQAIFPKRSNWGFFSPQCMAGK